MSTTRKIRRAAIYARLSVTTEESVSIERQIESASRFAELRGWTVALVATDDGVSATKNKPEDRQGWRQILDSSETFEAVIVWKTDRLARRVLDFLHADEALQKRGAALVAVEDPIDMTTPQGRAFATMLAVFAEMEAASISSRVTAARRQLVKSGRRAGGRPPFGFVNVPNPEGPGLILAQDPETIEAVKDAARRISAGESLYSVARRWEATGVLPRARKGVKNPGHWHDASVESILRSPALWGGTPYTPGRKPGEDRIPDVLRGPDGLPIIDEDLAIMTPAEHRAMLAVLDAAKAPGSRPRTPGKTSLLLGLAQCGCCGGPLYKASAASGKYRYYRCQNPGCSAPVSISEPSLETFVLAHVVKSVGHLPAFAVEIEGGSESPRLPEIETAISETIAELAETEDDDRITELNERLRMLKSARRTARETETQPVERTVDLGVTFGEMITDGTAERQREALLSALEAVVVEPTERRGNRFDPLRVRIVWKYEANADADVLEGQLD